MRMLALISVLIFSNLSFAAIGDGSASKILKESGYPENTEINLSVPQNQMDLSTLDQTVIKTASPHLEVSASSWTPDRYADSSYFADASNYRSAGLPQMAVSLSGRGWDFSAVNLAPKAGFAFSRYTRNGSLEVGGASVPVSQDMNLYSLFFGLETISQRVWWKHLQAYLDLGVMPTWSQASSTSFSEGNSNSYWAAKESAGLLWNFKAHDEFADTEGWAAELGIETTQGLGHAPLDGTGILAGLRVAL